MADGNGAAKDVDLLLGEVEELHVGESNNGESLVDLVVVDILGGKAGVLDGLGDGKRGSGGEESGLVGGVTPAENLGQRLDAELLELGLRNEDNGGSTIVDGSSVGSGNGAAVRDEDWANGLELVDVQVLDLLVALNLDGGLATTTANLDGGDLGENASLRGGLRLLVGLDGVLVLGLTAQTVVLTAELSLKTHELLLSISVAETILLHAIDEPRVAVLDASSEVGKVVGGVGHALGATSNNDVGVAGDDGLGAEDDGLQARGAHLVDGCADDGIRETGAEGALAGRGLAKTDAHSMLEHDLYRWKHQG